jgi:signal transduction histidine kinase
MPATQTDRLQPSRTALKVVPALMTRWPKPAVASVNVLLMLGATSATVVAFVSGSAGAITSAAILLASVAARLGGLPAVFLCTTVVVLPLHLLRAELPWGWLLWDFVVASIVGALVAELRVRQRRTEAEARETRSALREGQRVASGLRRRAQQYRELARRVGRGRVLKSARQLRFLAAAPFDLLRDPDYTTLYDRMARLALGELGDACRIDLWNAEGTKVERFWSAARTRTEALENFLDQWRLLEGFPQVSLVFRYQKPVVIEVAADTRGGFAGWASGKRTARRPILVVPIVIAGQVRATMALCHGSTTYRYDLRTLSVAEEFARRAAVVIMHVLRLEHAQSARQRAEQSEQTKADVLAGFSHDMRTPLQAAYGYTQLLLEQIGGPLSAKQIEYLRRIEGAQERLRTFVDNVLTRARLDSDGARVVQPVDLYAMARDVAAMFAVECQRKNLRLELPSIEDRVVVLADPEKVWRVLQNLLSNAVKYTAAHGAIALSWHSAGDRVEVQVTDNGLGVPNNEQEAIFRPFHQLDSRADGSGLGLAISRALARDMGGDLRVASEPGLGSTFTLRLPRIDTEFLAASSYPHPPESRLTA